MARKEDESRVRLEVDGKQAINQLGQLEMEAKELKVDMKNAKRGTEEYVKANNKLKDVQKKIKGVRQELGTAGMTMTQLSRYQRELQREISTTTTKGTADYKRLKGELMQVNNTLRQQRAELRGTKGFFSDIGKQLKSFGVLALSALGATAFFSQIQSMVDGSARLSDALSDVQKTTQLTDQELEKLTKNLRSFNTRTPRSELLGLAEIAGRLGIQGVKDIEGFVRAADKINVALGDVLGDPEKVMRELGKLTETFGIKEALGIEDSLIKIGSAINELGMASTANAGYLVEFSKRLGGIAPLAGISIENVLGLGATLDSLGQTSEVSTTALSKLFISMAKNAEDYAKFAKMEVADFVKLLNEDANEAFIRMLEGVKENSNGITELAATLGDLGQDGGRVVGVLGTLANNTERLRQQQEISNNAFREGTSVIDEFNLKNNNMAANLAKVQKWLAGVFVNSTIMSGLDSMISKFADWIAVPVSETLEAERMELLKLHTQIISTNVDTDERIKLINQLKQNYPEYLSQIDADKVTNEELSAAIRQVNEQLVNKIILQQQDEAIQKQSERVAKRQMDIFRREDKVRAQMIKLAEQYNLTIQEGMTLQEQAYDIMQRAGQHTRSSGDPRLDAIFDPVEKLRNEVQRLSNDYRVLNKQEEENNLLLDEKNKLIDRLGINLSQPEPPRTPEADPGADTEDPSGVPGNTAAADKKLEELARMWEAYQKRIRQITRDFELSGMEDEQREIAKVQDKYTALEEELQQHLTNQAINEEEYTEEAKRINTLREQEIAQIRQKYSEKEAEERRKAEETIRDATTEEQELARIKVNEHYDQLIELARKFGMDTLAIEDARRTALAELTKKHNQHEVEQARQIAEAKVMIARGTAEALGGIVDFTANQSGELTAFQKLVTGAQIGMDTAASLGRIVPLAIEAASGTGPAAPWMFAGYLASMGGMVLGAIGRATRALNRTSIPQWNGSQEEIRRSDRGSGIATPVTSFYHGGDTGREGMGFGDQYGQFTGYVHADEYVVPAFIRSHPFVADVMPAIESIRKDAIRGFYQGGDTSSEEDTTPDIPPSKMDPEALSLLKSINQKLDKMPTRLKAYLVDSEWQEFREVRDGLEDRYKR